MIADEKIKQKKVKITQNEMCILENEVGDYVVL